MLLPLNVKAVLRAITKLSRDARQIGRQVLGDAVGEIVLGRVAGEVGEGQHDEGETRGLGRRGDRGAWRGRRCRRRPRPVSRREDTRRLRGDCDETRRSREPDRKSAARGSNSGIFGSCEPQPPSQASPARGRPPRQRIDPDRPFDVLELPSAPRSADSAMSSLPLACVR